MHHRLFTDLRIACTIFHMYFTKRLIVQYIFNIQFLGLASLLPSPDQVKQSNRYENYHGLPLKFR